MKKSMYVGVLFVFILLLASCSGKNGEITVTPFELSEKEEQLINKAGGEFATFFDLNGQLAEGEDLQFWIEVYHNGEYIESVGKAWDGVDSAYKNTMISFAAMGIHDEETPVQLISGIPSGKLTSNYELNLKASSFGKLIGSKITLEKDRPAYLASLTGTASMDGALRTISSENGELPENIEEVEYAILYTILWTDKEND